MKARIAFLVGLFLAAPLAGAQDRVEDLGPSARLRILYAGDPGGEREQGFLELLRPWFARVDAIGLGELSMKTAESYDVVIADWRRRYSPAGEFVSEARSNGTLSDGFTKPIIMIGAVAAEIQHRSKIDWL